MIYRWRIDPVVGNSQLEVLQKIGPGGALFSPGLFLFIISRGFCPEKLMMSGPY
jgi:hypothetical protein